MITAGHYRRNESLPPPAARLIIHRVVRRLHTPQLFVGENQLDAAQARHAREVLRLADGTVVELFDDQGAVARGTLHLRGAHDAAVRVEHLESQSTGAPRVTIASAVPKGERADWMVEKLSELGTYAFIPLATERSVVLPEGKNKRDRWIRIATESAKQSRRPGVMRIESLMPVEQVLRERCVPPAGALVLSTGANTTPLIVAARGWTVGEEMILFIGPEGGWVDAELAAFETAGVRAVGLTSTVLRVETAAIAAAVCLLLNR